MTGHKSRHVASLSNVPFLGRTAWMSRIQQIASNAPRGEKRPQLMAFIKVWKWIAPYLRDCIHKKSSYQVYQNGETGVFALNTPNPAAPLRIAVVADWGTGTLEAEAVAHNVRERSPHYTIHLGDVYYMGETTEIRQNCLGERTNGFVGVRWPKGSLGSFALLGNHDMYSGGQGYFRTFLSKMGQYDAEGKIRLPQTASFFCLETAHWLILGLDWVPFWWCPSFHDDTRPECDPVFGRRCKI